MANENQQGIDPSNIVAAWLQGAAQCIVMGMNELEQDRTEAGEWFAKVVEVFPSVLDHANFADERVARRFKEILLLACEAMRTAIEGSDASKVLWVIRFLGGAHVHCRKGQDEFSRFITGFKIETDPSDGLSSSFGKFPSQN